MNRNGPVPNNKIIVEILKLIKKLVFKKPLQVVFFMLSFLFTRSQFVGIFSEGISFFHLLIKMDVGYVIVLVKLIGVNKG